MKKIAAIGITAITLAVNMAPLTANAAVVRSCNQSYGRQNVITVNGNCSLDELKAKLQQYGVDESCLDWIKNLPGQNCTALVNDAAENNNDNTNTGTNTNTDTNTNTNTNTDTNTNSNTNTNTNTNTSTNTQTSSFAQQVVNLVNAERAKEGLAPLTIDTTVEKAAMVRANEIQSNFDHTRPNGSAFYTVLAEQGVSYRGAGENIAWGQKTPEAVMNAWMNSPGHRANIMNKNFTRIGVGNLQNSAGTQYWVQLFTY